MARNGSKLVEEPTVTLLHEQRVTSLPPDGKSDLDWDEVEMLELQYMADALVREGKQWNKYRAGAHVNPTLFGDPLGLRSPAKHQPWARLFHSAARLGLATTGVDDQRIQLEPRSLSKKTTIPNGSPADDIGANSLFALFREDRNYLSVSDLVGPKWCEYAFDYTLRGGGKTDPALRLPVITTSSGKKIKVDMQAAGVKEKVLQGGRQVHESMEKEVMGEVKVVVTTVVPEERWAIRIINLLMCLEVLNRTGVCRELPVFGFLDDTFVLGMIDELRRIEDVNGVEGAQADVVEQQNLDAYFGVRKRSREVKYYMSDTKTRQSRSVPSERASQSARLQLMLYKRLFDQLSRPPFLPADRLIEHFSLDKDLVFSVEFREQIRHLVKDTETEYISQAETLFSVLTIMSNFFEAMRIELEETLSINYHLAHRHAKKEAAAAAAATTFESSGSTPELGEVYGVNDKPFEQSPRRSERLRQRKEHDRPLSERPSESLDKSNVQDDKSVSSRVDAVTAQTVPSKGTTEGDPGNLFLGSIKFEYDPTQLDRYLDHSLALWRGARAPVGVDLEDSYKCDRCEFRQGCEWREAQAGGVDEAKRRSGIKRTARMKEMAKEKRRRAQESRAREILANGVPEPAEIGEAADLDALNENDVQGGQLGGSDPGLETNPAKSRGCLT